MMVQLLTVPVQGPFDATDPEHRKVFADFLNSGKWNKRFSLEYPFSNVPAMIMAKLARYAVEMDGHVIRPIGDEKVRLEQESARLTVARPAKTRSLADINTPPGGVFSLGGADR